MAAAVQRRDHAPPMRPTTAVAAEAAAAVAAAAGTMALEAMAVSSVYVSKRDSI